MKLYLQTHKGYQAFPPIPTLQLKTPNLAQLTKDWEKSLKQSMKGYAQVKTWNKTPTRRLTF
jgi:5'-3' exonuclease